MTVQLTLIGLGQIGASIGLALSEQGNKIVRTGSDINHQAMKQAQMIGAVDRTTSNLNAAIRGADVVILAVPLDQVVEMAEAITPELKPGAILMDTSPLKAHVTKQASELLPEGCSYVGLIPVLNPRYLHTEGYGIAAAKADLFKDGLFGIVTPPPTDTRAVKLAADLCQLMGASPLFVDMYEMDGLMTSTHVLPQLVSAALLNATLDRPGWSDARKVAGRAFAEVSGPAAHLDDVQALVTAANMSRENIVRTLDDVIAALQGLRQDVAQENAEGLENRLRHARGGVNQWWQQRGKANWLEEEMPKSETPPTSGEMIGRMFGFGLGRKKKRSGR